jgi:BCD family chlorophyll transporter-like MFS transporter
MSTNLSERASPPPQSDRRQDGAGHATVKRLHASFVRGVGGLVASLLPFADAGTVELPLPRLLRLSLFQLTVGMAAVLLIGTLNRVMIVELNVPPWLVASMLAVPLLIAPLRALVGFRSDTHRSVLGWRRVPFLWIGTLLQFGGLAIMPFALILLSGDTWAPPIVGEVAAAFAFLLVGAGLHTVQTVGLALATDLAPASARPRVVAMLCAMLLFGMAVSALAFGALLVDFSEIRLIQVVQGSAVVTLVLNCIALWKQEPRNAAVRAAGAPRGEFLTAWTLYSQTGQARRHLVATALGTAGFSMQDVLLEPYGGKILHLPVGATTAFTAMLAIGGGSGLYLAARRLNRGADPHRVAAMGALVGLAAFAAVMFAAPAESRVLFGAGVTLIGLGGGLFAHGTLTASMAQARAEDRGLALGAWGAAQASAAGLAIAFSGVAHDGVAALAVQGAFGPGLADPAVGYSFVYGVEILLLFATLVAIGPLVRSNGYRWSQPQGLGLSISPPVKTGAMR